jgi:hypothetical protein
MSPKLCLGDIIKIWLQCNVRTSVKKTDAGNSAISEFQWKNWRWLQCTIRISVKKQTVKIVTVQYQNFSQKTNASYSATSEFRYKK